MFITTKKKSSAEFFNYLLSIILINSSYMTFYSCSHIYYAIEYAVRFGSQKVNKMKRQLVQVDLMG